MGSRSIEKNGANFRILEDMGTRGKIFLPGNITHGMLYSEMIKLNKRMFKWHVLRMDHVQLP